MPEQLLVVDLGIGNTGSIVNMVRRAGGEAVLGERPEMLADFDKVVLPGVGSFDAMADKLDASGFRSGLQEHVAAGKHLFGVCLGMQMLAQDSEEGVKQGLGLIPGHVRRFKFAGVAPQPKVPHMGWNRAWQAKPHALLNELGDSARFYFVHSYHFDCEDPADVLLKTAYHYEFTSAVQRGRVMGVQFHPEKSHRFGLQLFKNFIGL
jgi:glutamine amidotransferase